MESLKPKEKEFVDKYIKNNANATQTVKDVYKIEDDNYAGVKGNRLIRKDKIIKSIAERLPDDLLEQRHLELLNKREFHKVGEGEEEHIVEQPETQAVSKALDMAYKIKGSYVPDKVPTTINVVLVKFIDKEDGKL